MLGKAVNDYFQENFPISSNYLLVGGSKALSL